jgi:hypothetical protein
MTSKDFAYWLQGFFELSETDELTPRQVEIIKNHLKLVFYYEIDPSYGVDQKTSEVMQAIHDGTHPIVSQPKRTRSNHGDLIVKC